VVQRVTTVLQRLKELNVLKTEVHLNNIHKFNSYLIVNKSVTPMNFQYENCYAYIHATDMAIFSLKIDPTSF
jgi:hypothetical protein